MRFAIFLPPQSLNKQSLSKQALNKQSLNKQPADKAVPVLYWLSGLTCTDENFMQKAGAFRKAAELGIAIVAADTSPRGEGVADDEDGAYDLGLGAGFYLNASEKPWADHYHMYDYVVDELPALIEANFPVSNKRAISGHSMGGHGALTISLRNSDRYTSASAFSPICHPMDCPWGQKAFSAYLGSDENNWQQYDASLLMAKAFDKNNQVPTLVDQGSADNFLSEQLKPEALQMAAQLSNYPLKLNMQEGYDHSYFFISTFIEQHLEFHARYLAIS